MTIKEIEEASGMLRPNIRFYESEGFLAPEREKNGYRNYSEEDLKTLKKIKLLRSLHISLEQIKAMQQGEQSLNEVLKEHIAWIDKQQQELGRSQYVCEKMNQDGANYDSLDTQRYLQVLLNCRPEITEREEWRERDTPEPLRAPFLRIFARLFDYIFYMMLWMLCLLLWHRLIGVSEVGLLLCIVSSPFVSLLFALFFEPKFLYWFGTTPGKWILGLRVTYDLGGPIPEDMAWSRSWRAILMLHDWEYNEYFQIAHMFQAMEKGKPLDWDYVANTTIEQKDEKMWRHAVFVAAASLCVLVMVFVCRGIHG